MAENNGKDGTKRKPNSTLQVDSFVSGKPAPETSQGAVHGTAQGGVDGQVVKQQPRVKVALQMKGNKEAKQVDLNTEQFKQELSNWLRCGIHVITDKQQLVFRYLQIYNSFKELIASEVGYLKDNEHGTYIKGLMEYIKYDPSLAISTIKYTALYLNACFDSIVAFLDREQGFEDRAKAHVDSIKEDDGDFGAGI